MISQTKKSWSTLPWSEVEFFVTLNQNYLFKAAKRKDLFHREKINLNLKRDVRCNLLSIRRYSERKRPTLMFQKITQPTNSHFNFLLCEFLKFKALSSSQKLKLVKILSKNKNLFLQANFLPPVKIKRETTLLKILNIFPTQKSFQAFQFYWILLLGTEERFQYVFQPEAESLVEPNLFLTKSVLPFDQKRLQYQPLQCLTNFIKSSALGFHCKTFSKSKSPSEHLFLLGHFESEKFFKYSQGWKFANQKLTVFGLQRVLGFFFEILVERKSFNKSQPGLLQSFFLSGLDFDIKKWEQSKKIFSLELQTLVPIYKIKKQEVKKNKPLRFRSDIFFLLDSEQEFLLFQEREKNLTNSLKFLKDWVFTSFANVSFNSLHLSNLKAGINFQNHSILSVKNTSLILPSKSYQKRFFKHIKKIFHVSRGKSSKFLIGWIKLVLFFWGYSIFFCGDITPIRKIFRKVDSLLLFHIFRWARRNHPNWSGQKIANKYFPRGKVWHYKRKRKKGNWVFSDFSDRSFYIPKLSWLDRNDFSQDSSPQILFTGVFQSRKIWSKCLFS